MMAEDPMHGSDSRRPRYRVVLGGFGPVAGLGAPSGRRELAQRLAEARAEAEAAHALEVTEAEAAVAEAAAATQRARHALDQARALSEKRAAERVRRVAVAESVKAALDARRQALLALSTEAEALVAAVNEWRSVDRQRQATEAALVALRARSAGPETDAQKLKDVVTDMVEAESVLSRGDRRRGCAVDAVYERLVAARGAVMVRSGELGDTLDEYWGSEEGERPVPLVGLLPLAEDLGDPAASVEAALAGEAEARLSHEERLEALRRRKAEGPAAPDQAAVAIDLVREALADTPAVFDELLADLDDAAAGRVLAALPALVGDGHLEYLTGDRRVLSWAVALPANVGGVVGVVPPPLSTAC